MSVHACISAPATATGGRSGRRDGGRARPQPLARLANARTGRGGSGAAWRGARARGAHRGGQFPSRMSTHLAFPRRNMLNPWFHVHLRARNRTQKPTLAQSPSNLLYAHEVS
jgi:hypothetical protein